MNKKLLDALGELFVEGSPLYEDVKGLMELAAQEARERCAAVALTFDDARWSDQQRNVVRIVADEIRKA